MDHIKSSAKLTKGQKLPFFHVKNISFSEKWILLGHSQIIITTPCEFQMLDPRYEEINIACCSGPGSSCSNRTTVAPKIPIAPSTLMVTAQPPKDSFVKVPYKTRWTNKSDPCHLLFNHCTVKLDLQKNIRSNYVGSLFPACSPKMINISGQMN